MSSPDRPDEGHIADTGMFKRFVAHEQDLERQEERGTSRRWMLFAALIVLLIIIAVVIWLLIG